MDSQNPFEEEISLNQRKGGNSVREVRHGSRGGDIELLGLSQKEIGDDDARLVYLNDPVKSNERYEFAASPAGSLRPGSFHHATCIRAVSYGSQGCIRGLEEA